MDPLDSTAILTKAVQSVLQPLPINPTGVRRADLSNAEAQRGARTTSYSPAASIHPYLTTIAASHTATIRKAEERLQIAIDESSAALRLRIATTAYLMEIEAQREFARIRREGTARIREWFA